MLWKSKKPTSPPSPAAQCIPVMPRISRVTISYDQLAAFQRLYEQKQAASAHYHAQKRMAQKGTDAFTPFIEEYQQAVDQAIYRAFKDAPPPYHHLDGVRKELKNVLPEVFMHSVTTFLPVWERLQKEGWKPGMATPADIEVWHDDMIIWLHNVVTALKATKGQVTFEVPQEVEKFLDVWGLSAIVFWEKQEAAKAVT